MQNTEPLAEIKLAGNRLLKFYHHLKSNSLFIELQAPTTQRDGHGFGFLDGVTLQGAELQAFTEAIGALQWPQFKPAA
jgi:hypothetical protein